MTEKNRGKKKKNAAQRDRHERRFLPEATYTSRGASLLGMLGSLVLGAGVWAQWLQDEPSPIAPYLVAAGGGALFIGLWLGNKGATPIRVGDAGVAIERGHDLERIPWFKLENISIKADALLLKTAEREHAIPLGAHPKGIARLVQEAARRIGTRLDLSQAQHSALPKPSDSDGELLTVEPLQLTGLRCAVSDQVITFEQDARLCPQCSAVYHKGSVPKECKICGSELGDKAVSV